ncbi:hypothetical protein SUGI_0685690 [Cryptomeria japonica]|uniref:transcription termination factor MTEF1, chloroplastic-like n=1 Tax=Cryptomeria japonica TaxID=3369 RepID=UPI0024148D07|nr:transcription termination factor MTEF1, chloroplastic-like [Cryptomeria japonica]GLJ34113.1 hypothetical protein SUGI_0685690 [Cryptomeria japonica]
MRRRRNLLRSKSDHTAREAVHLLKDSGFTENKLKNTILRNPSILTLRVDSQLKPKMEFLKKLGLTTPDIVLIIFRRPRLLTMSLENCLVPRIVHLETLFGSEVHLCKALRRAPLLLDCDFKKQVIPRVEYLKNNIGILKDSVGFARALNAVLNHSFETLEKKTKHMASLGLAEEDISQIIKRQPGALRHSTQKMKENIDFLIRTTGLEPKIVASNAVILSFSVEKQTPL